MIHVTFSSSGAASLRQALGVRDRRVKVVDITDNLAWGPIARSDFGNRESWLDQNLPLDGKWDWIASGAKAFLTKLERSNEHVVWLAPHNATDLCGLHWYLDQFGGDRASFILVEHGFPGTWEDQAPQSIGVLGPQQFQYLLEKAPRTAWDEVRFPQERWLQLCDEDTNLRIIQQGIAVSVKDDHFDHLILQQCYANWQKLYKVIGEGMIAIWESQHSTESCFVTWRLRDLQKQGKIISNRPIVLHSDRPSDPILIRLV
ncbi:MAG: DUF3658 domain-containing protein [Novosphingobium sp.]|nr:DUF3658 domain-containing protein [Novosphingobium sp.]